MIKLFGLWSGKKNTLILSNLPIVAHAIWGHDKLFLTLSYDSYLCSCNCSYSQKCLVTLNPHNINIFDTNFE